MRNLNNILLIIPAYNEELNIIATYSKVQNYMSKNNNKLDVIVINDGSTDSTYNVCKKNKIPVINLVYNLGIGNAVQTGYMYAKKHGYSIAIQFDGDGQHDIGNLDDLIDPILNNKANMVIGSRFIDDTSSDFKSTKMRRTGIKIISWTISILTNKKILDTTSGYRAIDKRLIDLFATNYPGEYPEPISIVKAIKHKYKIKEIPVRMNERTKGKSSINAWKSVYYMINVVFSIIIEAIGGWKHEY